MKNFNKKIAFTILNKFAFVSLGSFGFITLLPNAMMSDSGSNTAVTVSTICLAGSVLMMTSGLVGIASPYPARVAYYIGGAGLGFQFIPLFAMSAIDSCRRKRK